MKSRSLIFTLPLMLWSCRSTESEAAGSNGQATTGAERAEPHSERANRVQQRLGSDFAKRAGRVEIHDCVVYAMGIGKSTPAMADPVKPESLKVSAPFVVILGTNVLVSMSPDSWCKVSTGIGIDARSVALYQFDREWSESLKP